MLGRNQVAGDGFNGSCLRKHRIIEWFSSGGNFSRLRAAKIEGYLAGNRDFCRQQAAEFTR